MLFIDNKYTRLYYHIVANCQSDNGEVHHIIPKALGGSNSQENLVKVSPKAHFILHRLLVKMVHNESHKIAMNYALFMMMNRNICHYSSRIYEITRNQVSESMRHNNPMHDAKVLAKRRGQKRSPETKKRITEGNLKRWSSAGRPIRNFCCPVCNSQIETRVPTKTTCSKKCSAILQHMK